MIPISVIIVTKNEERNIAKCLNHLNGFGEILVVDSNSTDETTAIATAAGIKVINFDWNKIYPKKRQWCLNNLQLKYDWVFFVDADEIVTDDLKQEIAATINDNNQNAGYFVTGRYIMDGKILCFGQPNRKIALFNRKRMCFPIIDDLNIPGMGEIEGHYQPVFCNGCEHYAIGHLRTYLIHDAMDNQRAWAFRHEKYARWEAEMNIKDAWPNDPIKWRDNLKKFLRNNYFRPYIIFCAIYFLMLGFMDGRQGLKFAIRKYRYYKLIRDKQREIE